MDILGSVKRLFTGVSAVAVATVGMFSCGAIMAFILSPQAALEWRRIEALPVLDSAGFTELAAGREAAMTGTLQDNKALTPEKLVVYQKDVWNVAKPETENSSTPSKPTGQWEIVETKIPELTIAVTGGNIGTQQVGTATMEGEMHTTIQEAKGSLTAEYDGGQLANQSIRIQGFANGDLVTVVGKKSTSGALIPNRLFGGDRVQLVDSIHEQARALFMIGVIMMICSPFFLAAGVLTLVLGKRRGWSGFGG